MNKILFYDNSAAVPNDISALLGVSRFSDIYYRKRSLSRWIGDSCNAAGVQFIELSNQGASRQAISQLKSLAGKNVIIMYLPAFLAFGCGEEESALFLRKLSLTRSSLLVSMKKDEGVFERMPFMVSVGELSQEILQCVMGGENPAELLREYQGQMHIVPSDVDMIDLRDPLKFTDYLTSNFDVRFFNSVQTVNDFVVLKRSTEIKKLHREYKYYHFLPPDLQMFFVQPYDYIVEGSCASYKMERLFVPDMALQWIHGSLDETGFERFLEKIFYYLSIRSVKKVNAELALAAHVDAFDSKVRARLTQFKGQAEYALIKPYLDANFGGVDALFERYFTLLKKHATKPVSHELCIGHGDLCFSNILYSKTTGLMRFIDPRGADDDVNLYMNPYYDLAKLSHSICGNYDFINYGFYTLEIDLHLKANLSINFDVHAWARRRFEKHLEEHGYSIYLIRLFEASLFLSMVPLHIDSPKKVLAFLVNANNIISELEKKLKG